MIEITPTIQLNEDEIELNFIHAPGPGGQNVNKVATAVQLRFNALGSPSLSAQVKERLRSLAGKKMNTDGFLTIESHQYRTQERNRQASIERLVHLIQRASEIPKRRYPTRPSKAAILRRLETKQKRSEIKRLRREENAAE
jgi:ribosome-associated protein